MISRSPFIGYNIRFKPFDKIILTADELNKIEKTFRSHPQIRTDKGCFCIQLLHWIGICGLEKSYV